MSRLCGLRFSEKVAARWAGRTLACGLTGRNPSVNHHGSGFKLSVAARETARGSEIVYLGCEGVLLFQAQVLNQLTGSRGHGGTTEGWHGKCGLNGTPGNFLPPGSRGHMCTYSRALAFI